MNYEIEAKGFYIIQFTLNIRGETEIQLVQQEVKKQLPKSHYENSPLKIRQEIGDYVAIYGTKAAIHRISNIYAKFCLQRTTVNTWKEKFEK